MSSRSRRTNWVSATVAALTVLLGGAPAALADSSPLVTSHPNLVLAQATGAKQVTACFDQILAAPFSFTDAAFFLQGYTEARKTGAGGLTVSSKTMSGGGFCVAVVFTGPGDVRSYSTLAVLAGAVTASVPGGGGAANVQSAVPLLGSVLPNTPGATLRPQLTATTTGPNGVLYTFSAPFAAAPKAQSFGFYTNTSGDTTFHPGTAIALGPGNSVAIGFSTADLALLPHAARFVAAEGAVSDAAGQGSPTAAIGSATQLLDLAGVAPLAAGPALSYHFDFSQAIPVGAQVCPAGFALFDASGVRYSPAAGATPTISTNRLSVSLTFAADTSGGDPAQLTLATVAGDALDGSNCAAATPKPLNSSGSATLPGASAKAGATSGPDLLSFQINRSSGFVSFVFDAPVAAATAPLRFHLVDRSGNLGAPPNQGGNGLFAPPPSGPQVNVSGDTVSVNFSAPTAGLLGLVPGAPDLTAVRGAIGVSVDEGAVTDAATAELNPLGSLGMASTGPTGPTVPPVPTFPTPPTTPATPAPKKPAAKVCHRTLTLHLLSSVSRNLRSATVTINGKKATVSKKLTVTISFAQYPGVKSVVVKIKGRLKNHHSISRTKTYKNRC